MNTILQDTGKISTTLFEQLLPDQCGKSNANVIQGPAFGVDTAVIDIGNGLGLATSSDPLSLIPSLGIKESAWLSVHLMANDMATTGFAPEYVQWVMNLPVDFSADAFKEYWSHIHPICEEAGIAITGGHTGRVPGQQSTIPGGGTMFLKAPLAKIITSAGAEPGDRIIGTKESALAASSILAKSFPQTIKTELGETVCKQAAQNFYRTSVLPEALIASEFLQPNRELKAMHDVTEGGILGAIAEMGHASGCGFRVHSDQIPVHQAALQITQLFEIDHRFCVGAGSMIMAVAKNKAVTLIEALHQQDIPATDVGMMSSAESGFKLVTKGKEEAFIFNGKDPYWDAFYQAMEAGWK